MTESMSAIFKWILGHATEVGLILGGIGGITGLVYLYDFLSSRKKRKARPPEVIPRDLEGRKTRGEVERYGDEWSKRLDNVLTDSRKRK